MTKAGEDSPETTAQQDSWAELAEVVRDQLRKRAELIPAMETEEVEMFVNACREALFMEINAMTFDKRVELERNRISAE